MKTDAPPPRWAHVATLAGVLIAFTLAFVGDARAQSLDRLDAHTPPDLADSVPGDGNGFLEWLDENKWWLLFGVTLLAAAFLAYYLLSGDSRHKKLQRDALEKLRKSLVESCKATRGPAKRVWLTGGPSDPPCRLGRYAGHHRSVETVWIAYRTWLLGQARVLAVNPADLASLDVPEIHIRAIAVNHTRSLGFAVPDVHNARQRADWARACRAELPDAEAFAEAWKHFYARAVDNALAFYDAMNAAEDRSFLRQEVTRSQDERTDTILAPAPQPAPTTEANNDA